MDNDLPVMVPELQDEHWFHGNITRQHAEALLKHVSWMYFPLIFLYLVSISNNYIDDVKYQN